MVEGSFFMREYGNGMRRGCLSRTNSNGVKVVQWEDEKIEVFRCVAEDFYLIAEIFEILARREFLVYNENYK